MDAMPDRRLVVPSRASAAINNLRAIVVLLVVAVHSVLAYLVAIGPGPGAFDKPPYAWRTFPIVDAHRFLGFDIFCAWGDAFLMALFFLVSGFFVWPALERSGAARFVERRALRLGPPFILGIVLLMPVANFPAYLQTTAHPGLVDYIQELLALPFWPAGPMWFLWFLLALDVIAGVCYQVFPRQALFVRRLSNYAQEHPSRFLAGLMIASELSYLPFGYPFGPMSWFQFGPISVQASFPGLYVVYFGAGVAIGALGIEQGLIARDGPLARHWKSWCGAASIFFVLWLLASAKTYLDPAGAPPVWKLVEALALPPACFTSCCFVLAATIRFASYRSRVLEHFHRNAFEIYLLHCVFVVWSQYALLALNWPAIPKATIVFVATLAASWTLAGVLRRLPVFDFIIGATNHMPRPLRPLPRPVLPLSD